MIDIDVFQTVTSVSFEVEPNTNIININKVTIEGTGGGATNLSTTQTASNFTINSDTGDDALVPLGNGTLAGATLNDYTTAEKNKLVDTYTKGEVDAKITGVYKIKGSVANYAALPSSGQVIGDVWNLLDTGGNYVWTASAWDALGTTVDISGKANIDSPTFTGIPLAPTATAGTNNTQIATTAFTTTAIAGKMNNPSLTASYIPKALTATTIGNSRLLDINGYLGIGTVNTPTKDITLGYQTNRELGIEESPNTIIGKNLMVSAGRAINYTSGNFSGLGQSIRNWFGLAAAPNGDVFSCGYNGSTNIYKQAGGSVDFIDYGYTGGLGMCVSLSNDLYITKNNNGIYKQTNSTGVFVSVASLNNWWGIAAAPNGDIYACSVTDIYIQVGGIGSFIPLNQTNIGWQYITVAPNGDVYATGNLSTDIWIRTGGIGNFTPLSQTSRLWTGITASPNGDIYAAVNNGDIYKRTGGINNFNPLSQTSRAWGNLVSNSTGSIYATQLNVSGDIYFLNNNSLGTANLQGGTLKLNSGTGKGTGVSDIEMYTGQVLASGTDMQTSTLRAKIDNTGLMTLPSVTNSLINGDATGKAVVTKEYLTNSQTVFVPYTGATTDVNLGLNDITAAKLIKEGGFDYQFLKADGSVDNNIYLTSADLPSTLDLYATTTASDISGYTVLVRNIADTRYNTTAVDVSTGVITSVGQLVGSLVTDANIISGNPGVFDFKTIGNISRTSGTGQAEFFFRIYKRNLAGTETLIAQSDYTLPVTNGGYVEFSATSLWNDGIFLDTDRVVLKYYANRLTSPVGSDPTYQFQFGGTSPVRSSAAIPTSVMPNIYLRDLADVENIDALNNEILYWNDPASLWEHSLAENLVPLATATQKGLVSTTTQTFAGDKTFTGATSIVTNSLDLGIQVNSNDVGIEVNASGIGIEVYGILAPAGVFNLASTNTSNIVEFKKDYVVKALVSNDGIITGTGLNASGQTINTIASFDGSKNVVSLPTATYPSLTELALVKGVSGSSIQTQLNGKQDTLQSTVNIKSINGNSILGSGDLTISATAAAQSPFTMLANNSDVSAIPTQQVYKDIAEQTYGLSPSWAGTAPTTIVANTYQWQQVGSLVTVRVNLIYSTAGSITQAIIPLPTDMPTPFVTGALNNASDILYYGVGMFNTLTTSTATVGRVCFLRRNAANTGFEFAIIHSSAVSSRVISLTLQYFT